jgi:hypothetical protein
MHLVTGTKNRKKPPSLIKALEKEVDVIDGVVVVCGPEERVVVFSPTW